MGFELADEKAVRIEGKARAVVLDDDTGAMGTVSDAHCAGRVEAGKVPTAWMRPHPAGRARLGARARRRLGVLRMGLILSGEQATLNIGPGAFSGALGAFFIQGVNDGGTGARDIGDRGGGNERRTGQLARGADCYTFCDTGARLLLRSMRSLRFVLDAARPIK
jgi:hypothetical protein